eukprot:6520297-Pyramimonas_sp.AAC.1
MRRRLQPLQLWRSWLPRRPCWRSHHRADVALGCHMYRLGDALRAVAKTLAVDMDFVRWGMEIKGDDDKTRREPFVAADIKVEVCVAEPAL